jgi:hypothetical protein
MQQSFQFQNSHVSTIRYKTVGGQSNESINAATFDRQNEWTPPPGRLAHTMRTSIHTLQQISLSLVFFIKLFIKLLCQPLLICINQCSNECSECIISFLKNEVYKTPVIIFVSLQHRSHLSLELKLEGSATKQLATGSCRLMCNLYLNIPRQE